MKLIQRDKLIETHSSSLNLMINHTIINSSHIMDDLMVEIIMCTKLIILFCMIVGFIALLSLVIITDFYIYKLNNKIQYDGTGIIYITDLPKNTNFIDKIYKSSFNRLSQRPIHVFDVYDIPGIINMFKTTEKTKNNLMIYIDSLCDDYTIAQALQNAVRSFQKNIYCCVMGKNKSVGIIVALSSDILYFDNYARFDTEQFSLSQIAAKNILKKTLQYQQMSIFKKKSLLNLFCNYVTKDIGINELNKHDMHIYQVADYHHDVFDILKDLKICMSVCKFFY